MQLPSSAGLPMDDPLTNETDEPSNGKEVVVEAEEQQPPPPPPKDSVPTPKESGEIMKENTFRITLEKEGDIRIGLDTVARKQPPALKIKKVKDGLVKMWNASNPDLQVKEDYLILEVNGESTDIEKMYGAISANSLLRLLIQRS
eukprot:CAMPEP_0177200916 /NCGR_PEP_ID=MMETSP0367-20130122/26475_1 /TAXON_ID=447022 ORGANISM="Scrippsiella hangoei-like, Strain SHHI-4" /NCGR_SAMPLE_ID=MMETSP0367 /ASSEMBLY_ACC=CAM_ASM_000362 /LENGTH=144 /DNA_ID=CAMNT_0018649389 /DNA_START=146 /DNA_END=580 /DNA_ORIENTATION=-